MENLDELPLLEAVSDGVFVKRIWKPELHTTKSCSRRPFEAIEEIDLAVQHAKVGCEFRHLGMTSFGDDVVWWPTPAIIAASNLTRFMANVGATDLEHLQRLSTTNPECFWNEVIADLDIRFYEPYTKVLDTAAGIQWPRWCLDGRLNIVHNCVDKRCHDGRPAIKWEGEDGSRSELSYRGLAHEVNRTANALFKLGLRKGDVVALFMPMLPETAIALFAVTKIGGIVLPLFSGYGADAIAARLVDSEAKCLITCDGSQRRGRDIPMKNIADKAIERCPAVKHVVVVRRMGLSVSWNADRDRWWTDIVINESAACESEQMSPEDPLMLIYTSGTTGRPKGTVHTHGGFPIKAAQDLSHVFDLKPEDTVFWVTDIGWMMGPWELFGATIIGATIVIYEGALDYPGPERIWASGQRVRCVAHADPYADVLSGRPRRHGGFDASHSRLDR